MTTCCIGYYSSLTRNPQEIQGLWYDVSNDPLYIKDFSQMIIPIESEITERNKPYIGIPDLLTADENAKVLLSNNLVKIGDGYKNKDKYYGYGLNPPGGKYYNFPHIIEHEDHEPKNDHEERDIRKGESEIKRYKKYKEKKKKSRKIIRPSDKDVFKMERTKPSYPAEKLKKKLMRNPSSFRKRTQIKNLLDRLR